MKTPKRDYKTPSNQLTQDIESDFFEDDYNKQEARWKRKNRVKQLKRSLQRYKHGTNLDFYSHELHAYMLLQELKKPDKKADANKWNFYTQRLLDIQSHIMQAIAQASRETGACWEREEQDKRYAQKLFQEKLEEHLLTKERKEQDHE